MSNKPAFIYVNGAFQFTVPVNGRSFEQLASDVKSVLKLSDIFKPVSPAPGLINFVAR